MKKTLLLPLILILIGCYPTFQSNPNRAHTFFRIDSLNNERPNPLELLNIENNIFDLVNQHRNTIGLPDLRRS